MDSIRTATDRPPISWRQWKSCRPSRATNSSASPRRSRARFFAFGDSVCNAGEPADGLYVIKSGSVRVFSEEHGKEISMGVRKAGEVFAEIAMLRSYRHELSARAALKTELWFIPRTAIEAVIAHNPAALDFVNNYVAISSAGGLVARLFDLRGKVSKAELEEFVRSVGVKRVSAGKEILKQDARDDRRLYVRAPGPGAHRAPATPTTSTCWPRWARAKSSARRPA